MSVHNLRREPTQPGDVSIGRAGRGENGTFGNPFAMGGESFRGAVLARFEAWARNRIARDPVYRMQVRNLAGRRPFCLCAPLACHGDILEQLAGKLRARGGTTAAGQGAAS
jgi:hypothetical protein